MYHGTNSAGLSHFPCILVTFSLLFSLLLCHRCQLLAAPVSCSGASAFSHGQHETSAAPPLHHTLRKESRAKKGFFLRASNNIRIVFVHKFTVVIRYSCTTGYRRAGSLSGSLFVNRTEVASNAKRSFHRPRSPGSPSSRYIAIPYSFSRLTPTPSASFLPPPFASAWETP